MNIMCLSTCTSHTRRNEFSQKISNWKQISVKVFKYTVVQFYSRSGAPVHIKLTPFIELATYWCQKEHLYPHWSCYECWQIWMKFSHFKDCEHPCLDSSSTSQTFGHLFLSPMLFAPNIRSNQTESLSLLNILCKPNAFTTTSLFRSRIKNSPCGF